MDPTTLHKCLRVWSYMKKLELQTPEVENIFLRATEIHLSKILVDIFHSIEEFDSWNETFFHTILRGFYSLNNFPPYNFYIGDMEINEIEMSEKYSTDKQFALTLLELLRGKYIEWVEIESRSFAVAIHMRLLRIHYHDFDRIFGQIEFV